MLFRSKAAKRTTPRFSWLRRHGFALGGFTVLTCAALWFALGRRSPGLNLWSELVSGLTEASIITGALAAGLCAWMASRWIAAASPRIRSSALPVGMPIVVHWLQTVGVCVLAFPAAILVLIGYALVSGAYGSPYIPWLLALWSFLLVSGSFGYALGAWLGPKWFTAPAAVLGFIGIYVLLQSLPIAYGVRALFPVVATLDTEFSKYLPQAMVGQVVWFAALAALCVLVVIARGAGLVRSARVLGAIFALVGALGAVNVVVSNGQYTTGYNSRNFVCQGESPVICLNPGYVTASAGLSEKFGAMNELVRGTRLEATVLEQNIEGIGDEPAPGARSVYLEEISDSGFRLSVYRYVAKYGTGEACWDPQISYENSSAHYEIVSWLSQYDEFHFGEASKKTDRGEAWNVLQAIPEDERAAWFRAHESGFFNCTLSLRDIINSVS